MTEAIEMGYYDASYELGKAHLSLLDWYNSNGGEEVSKSLKEKRSLLWAKDKTEAVTDQKMI